MGRTTHAPTRWPDIFVARFAMFKAHGYDLRPGPRRRGRVANKNDNTERLLDRKEALRWVGPTVWLCDSDQRLKSLE
jgi:hypothetical protein